MLAEGWCGNIMFWLLNVMFRVDESSLQKLSRSHDQTRDINIRTVGVISCTILHGFISLQSLLIVGILWLQIKTLKLDYNIFLLPMYETTGCKIKIRTIKPWYTLRYTVLNINRRLFILDLKNINKCKNICFKKQYIVFKPCGISVHTFPIKKN